MLGTTVYGGAWDYHVEQDVDITALVAKWAAGTLDNNGLAIVISTGYSSGYYCNWQSKEKGTDVCPILLIDYVPEPATLAVLALGGLGMMLRRRRK